MGPDANSGEFATPCDRGGVSSILAYDPHLAPGAPLGYPRGVGHICRASWLSIAEYRGGSRRDEIRREQATTQVSWLGCRDIRFVTSRPKATQLDRAS